MVRKVFKQQYEIVELYPSCITPKGNNFFLAGVGVGSGKVQFLIEQLIQSKIVVQ